MIELRELTPEDTGALQQIYSSESTRFLGRGPMNEAEALRYTSAAMAAAARTPRTRYVLGITVRAELLGVIKLDRDGPAATISYILRVDVWGRGYATKGVRKVLALGLGHLGLPEIRAKHHPDNPASGRVLTKSGFTPAGRVDGFETYLIQPPPPVPAVWLEAGPEQ
ncbi:GNAT family N-acetyltransferase [Kitasatospora sp. NBC_01287]|uniref:GNAT family N-acetyltransferase n=1 Tax=Kitasatospora sp. NBC_01287 TaxID=2903573 RepID=UPI00224ED4AD|nr:GNAT family N-acetyltransferase [Kitasatospora sp. NBC_01287]MCX4750320.1 GNAT family N-acetyltransferase [Kitasatospora sp. NBC_01287]